jgi:nucleoid-associated protein YgaU
MGMFSFLSNAGKKLMGHGDDSAAIKKEIEESFSDSFEEDPVLGLVVDVEDDTVVLAGVAKDAPTREKVILIAGNVEGVANVNADQLVTPEIIAADNTRDLPEPVFYAIKKGDTLWGISEDFYKDGSKYPEIVAANLEVIKDADKIYPGQSIRIPTLA